MKKQIEKRLNYLYSGELFASIIFLFVSFLLHTTYPPLHLYELSSFWAAFGLLEFLLFQGAWYWFQKRKQLKRFGSTVTPLPVIKRLYSLRKWNLAYILVCPLFFIIDWVKWGPSLPTGGLVLSSCIFVFAILEYINYFYIQLSYDNKSDIRTLLRHRKLKTSSLRKDFARLKGNNP